MEHYLIAIYLLIFLLCFALMLFTLVVYLRSHQAFYRNVALFQAAVFVYTVFDFVVYYRNINFINPDLITSIWLMRISYILYGIHLFVRTLFTFSLIETPISSKVEKAFLVCSLVYAVTPMTPFFINSQDKSPQIGYFINEAGAFAMLIYFIPALIKTIVDQKKKELYAWQVLLLVVFIFRVPSIILNQFVNHYRVFNRYFPDSYHKTIFSHIIFDGATFLLLNIIFLYLIVRGLSRQNAGPIAWMSQPNASDLKLRFKLTQREMEILRLIISGKTNKEIAGSLFISEPTVKTHVTHIFQKVQVRDRIQLLTLLYQKDPTLPENKLS